jgi:TonB family protein
LLLAQSAGVPWAVRLHLAAEPVASVRVERSVYCAPQQIDQGDVSNSFAVTLAPGERPPTSGRTHIIAELTLDPTGSVQQVALVERSGIRDLDDHMLQTARTWRFFPALIDGVAVASWVRTDRRRMEY